jgi:excisionase family DNA binding protein
VGIPDSIRHDPKLWSTRDVADRLGVHRTTVNHWIATGLLKASRHGVFFAIHDDDLKQFERLYVRKEKGKAK